MKDSIRDKLETLLARSEEVSALLATPEAQSDPQRFRALSQEYAQLEPVVADFRAWQAALTAIESARTLTTDADTELRALAEDELRDAERRTQTLEEILARHLIPADPQDRSNIFLEIRAGTGGDEAALFAGDLFRMYARYCESRRMQVEILSESPGEHGGYKEIIARISGQGIYARFKFEAGTHRVQRVPATEAQGRIHTSACTVAILPEPDEIEQVAINPAELKVDTYRASGAGGQHVNKTESAIRITHLPTGIVVECQDERSQHKNRARAMSLLSARLTAAERERAQSQQAQARKLMVGSGDRSERIRTYNFPQGRLTDHRIGLTLYQLDRILQGDLDPVIEPLIQESQAEALAALAG